MLPRAKTRRCTRPDYFQLNDDFLTCKVPQKTWPLVLILMKPPALRMAVLTKLGVLRRQS